ncbi:hypothetical protein [Fibrella aquatilis]|uniref:Lipoprotein n=1 Tax=Fibrella aquatilis TaxID=2817059 RepID=A0A939G2E0_9BACT|nr:hypothetical protein [Fibrella aquatilis]MBO0930799.1 hypothetical protein [Fibrella aquatilis]
MRKQLIQGLVVLGVLGTAATACFVEPNYSDTPEIRFLSVTKQTLEAGTGVGRPRRDSVIVTINFQDGTGDLGENTQDTTRQRVVFGKETWGNYEIKTFQLVSGKYEELPLAVLSKLYFPRLTREGQKGSIEGVLDFSQIFPYQRNFKMVPVKFQIRIRDRGLRISNTIETDTLSVPINGR